MGYVSEDVIDVFWNDQKIEINQDRSFLLGFDRDEILIHKLKLVFADSLETIKFVIAPYEYEIKEIKKLPQQYTSPIIDPALKNRIILEENTLKAIRNQLKKNIFTYRDSSIIRPVDKGWISAGFGDQRIINGNSQNFHNGIDIAVPMGTPIKAMTSAVVALTGDFYYNGKFVLLDHGKGLSSIYLHMSNISVKKGDFVRTGDKIGEVGSTGRSTGNHLHWGISWFGSAVNPLFALEMNDEFLVFRRQPVQFWLE